LDEIGVQPMNELLGRARELTRFSRGFNTHLTASIPVGELSKINRFIISQAGHITTFPPSKARKKPMILTNVRC